MLSIGCRIIGMQCVSLGSVATLVRGGISIPRGLVGAKVSLRLLLHAQRAHGIKMLHQALEKHDYAVCRYWASGAFSTLRNRSLPLAELPAYRAGGGLRSVGRPSTGSSAL